MRYYYLAIILPTFLIFLAACETQELSQVTPAHSSSNSSACYLENATNGERLCVQIDASDSETNVEAVCESLGNDSTGYAFETGPCATASAVNGSCKATGVDVKTSINFYYPDYDEASSEEYCNNLGAPYGWQAQESQVVIQGIYAKEDIPADATLSDLVNDTIIKFED